MFGIGFTELAIILVIALIAIGPEKLPDIMKALGKAFGEFKKATEELQKSVDDVKADADVGVELEEVLEKPEKKEDKDKPAGEEVQDKPAGEKSKGPEK
jgi:sec-independent protein translocase protein TatB